MKFRELHDALTHSRNLHIWNNLNTQLKQDANNTNYNRNYHTQSRTLQNALAYTLNTYVGYGNANAYKILLTLCNYLTEKPIGIVTHYRQIQSTETYTQDMLYQELTSVRGINYATNDILINFYHIAKGKTYLKNVLDELKNNHTRYDNIENICKTLPNQFIRIYKGIPRTNDITVFMDQPTVETIDTIFVMLPNLLGLEAPNPTDTNTSDIKTQKTLALRHLFKILYSILTDDLWFGNDICATITNAINAYLKFFKLTATDLEAFAKRLANLRNENEKSTTQNRLNSIANDIYSYEHALLSLYGEQLTLQRRLNALQFINTDNIQPLIDALQNTAAIEIISANANKIYIRVTAPFQYFSSSDLDAYEKNENSYYNQDLKNNTYLKTILHKIFSTKEYKLIAQAIIKLENSTYSHGLSIAAMGSDYLSDYTECPNPHLYRYNCWSAAIHEINKNICANNFELIVPQIIAAVQSINIAENASFIDTLVKRLRENEDWVNRAHIIDEKGETHTLKEMIQHEKNIEEAKKYKQTVVEKETPISPEEYEEIVNTMTGVNTSTSDPVDDIADENLPI